MKKLIVFTLVIVALLAGVQLTFSSKAEEAYASLVQQIENGGYFTFSDDARSGGLLESTFSSTVNIKPNSLAGDKSKAYAAQLGKLNFKLQHTIKHGPFPELMQGDFRPAKALIISTLDLTDDARKNLADFFPEGNPITFTTWIEFSGDSSTQIHSGKFSVEKDGATFTSGGLSGYINFLSLQSRIQSEIQLPSINFKSDKQESFSMRGFTVTTDLLPDEIGINIGDMDFNLDEIALQAKFGIKPIDFKLSKLAGNSKTRSENGKLSSTSSMTAEDLLVNGKQFGPVAYKIGVSNLDAKTIKEFQDELLVLEKENLEPEKKQQLYGKKAADLISKLLLEAPVLNINKISFYFQDEKFNFDARLTINGDKFGKNAAAMPPLMMLLQALDLESNITIPKALISAIPQPKPQLALSNNDAVTPAQTKPGIAERMEKFTQLGYFNQDGRYYRSKIIFRQGRLTMNGQAMNPMQVMQ